MKKKHQVREPGTAGSRAEHGRRKGRAGVILVLGVGAFLAAVLTLGMFNTPQPEAYSAGSDAGWNADRIDVVYFHRAERCDACLWAEQMSRQTVERYFAPQLASGKVTFQAADVQKPENRALASKYRAGGSQLFLNYVKDGRDRIVEAQQTYPFVGNQARFSGLLRDMIAGGLEKS